MKTTPHPTTYRIICAWCRKIMGFKPGKLVAGEMEDTHGICSDCLKGILEDLDIPTQARKEP